MKDAKTPAGRAAIMEPIANGLAKTIEYLWARWQDENKYEDFADYEKAMRKAVDEKAPIAAVLKCHKRPFGVTVQLPGFPYKCEIAISGKHYGWKAVK